MNNNALEIILLSLGMFFLSIVSYLNNVELSDLKERVVYLESKQDLVIHQIKKEK